MARIRNRISLLVSVVVVSLLFFAAFAAMSYAADGDSLQNATKLGEVTGPQYPTFTAPLFAYTPYTGAHFGQYWFVFNLNKGETLTADFTWGPTVSGLTATVLATSQTPQTSSTALSGTVQRLVFSSPVDNGAYAIQVVSGSGAGDTFSITPTIATSTYAITPSAGANGSISPNVAQAVTYGGSQQFTFTPDTGYQVADVKVDNVSVGHPASYTFNNVTATHTISVTFAIKTFTLTPSATLGGVVSPSGVQTVNYGTDKTFTITPNSGYHLTDVSKDGSSIGASTSVTFSSVSANHTLAATFVPNSQPVHRFRNLKNGFYLLSADPNEWNTINTTLYKTWTDEGVAYTINTTNPLNSSPLWRFRNIKGGNYLYSADPTEKANIIANLSKTWFYEGPTYNVDRTFAAGGKTVDRFINRKNGTYLYSADPAEQTTIINTLSATWKLEGPAFYLAP